MSVILVARQGHLRSGENLEAVRGDINTGPRDI